MSVKIQPFTSERKQDWDKFVENHPDARFSFLTGYKKAVEAVFGYKPFYFFLEKNGKIEGVFPAFLIGKKAVSVPFGVYGGLLAGDLTKEEIAFAVKEIKARCPRLKIAGEKQDFWQGLFCQSPHKFGVLPLDQKENLWKDKFDYSVRKNIKKAESFGLKVFEDNSESAVQKYFYPLYLKEMKRFGTPPYSFKFFANFLKYLPNKVKVLYAQTKEGRVVAGLFGIGGGKYFYIAFNPSLPDFWHQRPNDLLHWQMLQRAHQDGYQFFDFGAMRYEGQINFKRKWGVEERDYFIYSTEPLSRDKGMSRAQKILSWVWRKAAPNSFSKIVGHYIRKKIAR